jgi:transcriptional regulator with XRE-family HTH domain
MVITIAQTFALLNRKKKYILQLFVGFTLKAGYISSDMTLAEKMRALRDRKKMSVSEEARLSELATTRRSRIAQGGYLSRLESGKETNPSLMKLMTLCGIYQIDPYELFEKATGKNLEKPDGQIPSQQDATERSSDAEHGSSCSACSMYEPA